MKNVFLIPVQNDYESLGLLVEELNLALRCDGGIVSDHKILVVDDGSNHTEIEKLTKLLKKHKNLEAVRRGYKGGHQSAIFEGLKIITQQYPRHNVVILDADGEDRPSDAVFLAKEVSTLSAPSIICARRGTRDVKVSFHVGYFFFNKLFRIMTGVSLRSGNFMVIPESMVKSVLTYPGIENHIAASISRYSPSLLFRQFDRGKRIAGKSRMNFSGLILHAYGAFTIYADIILAKFFLGLIFTAMGLSLVAGLVVILKILNLIQVIPGWTSIFVVQIAATIITLLATSVTGLMLLLRVNSTTGKGFPGSTKSL